MFWQPVDLEDHSGEGSTSPDCCGRPIFAVDGTGTDVIDVPPPD